VSAPALPHIAVAGARTAHGGSAPVNARLLALIREAEEQRTHFTCEQLLAMLRDAASGDRREIR
jgi:hypothetical protein